ncbi:WXG100 family type VII secretion target [Mycobacterium sp. IS-3022]|uniref:WXG100 family type VII secretion target n=1 Tax=Mycobacterium sp. IS-3022 TaxID=1772277 RepID=UPI0007415C1B|nr:WXG100 family type VII secretion target [Mycobacterium sp. IS-3022]KUH99165.1 Fis family transcriptional regulator [Mycobacterium sp. IS-3022]
MADFLKVSADQAFNTAHSVANDAEELREELTRIVGEWDNISRGWSGAAASAYSSIWEEWHEGAAKVVESLTESSRNLAAAAVLYEESDAASAETVASVPIDVGL